MEALSISALEKSYGSFKAVKGISFSIEKGEFFALLGPNGAGKTTTINILCGLANIGSGTVKVFGKDLLKDYQEVRALIGLVPQEFNFDQFIKLEDMLVFQAGFFNIPRKEAKKRAEKLMKQLGIYEKRHAQLRMLSGGMKRRAIIARALMHKPRLLLYEGC
jgi:ABC-2 type transport system ATP-binding protein